MTEALEFDETIAVLDDASAEMLLEQIKTANEQYEKMESWYFHQLEAARALRDRTVQLAENSLRAYFEMVPTHNTKTQKSYELPGGKLVLKKQEPEYYPDDKELIPWLKANGMDGMIKVRESTNWAELKKLVKVTPDGTGVMTADGEILPGVKVTQRDPKFTVTVK